MSIDVEFDRVSKRYRIPGQEPANPGSALQRIRRAFSPQRDEFCAVRDLSFSVPHGQALGIIGHNGAGKSTILKLLSGITSPTEGVITVQGRVAALLEVGSGFHPELTGRENIFLSGSILGMTRREIHAKLESIVDFAGIRQFIDVPVKRYSSGMYVRLGFAIAAHLEPDVLLLDEVLAVGDAGFQQKSKDRILELKAASTTIIFISHDLHAVQQVCDRVLVVQKGAIIYDGSPESAIGAYDRAGRALTSAEADARLAFTSMALLDADDRPVKQIRTGQSLRILVEYRAAEPIERARLSIIFHTPDWKLCCFFQTGNGFELDLPAGPGAIEFACDELGLQPGLYNVDPMMNQDLRTDPVAWIQNCVAVQVGEGDVRVEGTFYHPHRWNFVNPGVREDLVSSIAESREI